MSTYSLEDAKKDVNGIELYKSECKLIYGEISEDAEKVTDLYEAGILTYGLLNDFVTLAAKSIGKELNNTKRKV